MNKNKDRILITGGTGLIGSNLTIRLKSLGFEVLSIGSNNDLRNPIVTNDVFSKFKPTIVYHLAAKVGGIYANYNYKASFYSDNTLINTNVVNACSKFNTEYIFAMGTGCAYPKRLEEQLLKEDEFLDGIPEVTNDAYAYAKRGLLVHLKSLNESLGVKYNYCLPANIYGPYDNFHVKHSHVVPGLIRRFCDSFDSNLKEIMIWGDGTAKRDFLYIDDCISAIICLSEERAEGVYNIATGVLTPIADLANMIKLSSGFNGNIKYDKSMPNGQMQRIMDVTKIKSFGWEPKTSLSNGLDKTIKWFRTNKDLIRES
tara:strand:+ start:460 stop:1401 length:942 start_codon:yes stop_codon:yes gene_type:complete